MVDQPNINIQLGDIIEILSENPTLNNNKFFVKYIDSKKITIINIENNEEEILKINENNELEESIEEIILLSRADFPGYAKQNNLIKGTWIDVYFKGDIPFIIIGKITDLVEDMIEIKTFPENEIIYIDFAYKGIPEDLPIEKIVIRTKPDASEEQEDEVIIGDAKESEKLEEDLEFAIIIHLINHLFVFQCHIFALLQQHQQFVLFLLIQHQFEFHRHLKLYL